MITDRALSDLWPAVNAKRRKGSDTIKVSASSLGELLQTHHALVSQPGKLAVVLGDDHASLIGNLSADDFKAHAKAVSQRHEFNRQKEK